MAANMHVPPTAHQASAGAPQSGRLVSIANQLKRRGLLAASVALLTGALAKRTEESVQAADGDPLVLGRTNTETTSTVLERTTSQVAPPGGAVLEVRVVSSIGASATAIAGDGGDRGTGVVGIANLNGGVGVVGICGPGSGALGVHNIGVIASGLAGLVAQGSPAVQATGSPAVVASGGNAGPALMASGGVGVFASGRPQAVPNFPPGPGLQADGNPGVDARGDVNAIIATGKANGVVATGGNYGLVGTGALAGVVGSSASAVGVHGTTLDGVGTRGVATGAGRGVVGLSKSSAGVEARNTSTTTRALLATPAQAGEFFGDVVIHGQLFVVGPLSAAMVLTDGSRRSVYGVTSPEPLLEDVGAGNLVDGTAKVELDTEFATALRGNDYHVFLSPRGDSNGLYVGSQSSSGFVVREQRGGKSTLAFSYRVLAKRSDIATSRFAHIAAPADPLGAEEAPSDEHVLTPQQLPALPRFPAPVELPGSLRALVDPVSQS